MFNIYCIYHMNKKQTIVYWARLITTYFSQIILLNSHISSISRIKNFDSFFIKSSQHIETIKAHRLRRGDFISFSVFGAVDEKLALVFDLLLNLELCSNLYILLSRCLTSKRTLQIFWRLLFDCWLLSFKEVDKSVQLEIFWNWKLETGNLS